MSQVCTVQRERERGRDGGRGQVDDIVLKEEEFA